MRFQKIYIEITNKCNLNCSFCPKREGLKEEMTPLKFEHILKEIKKYTNTIYLHVQGEPLLHTKLDEILSLALKYKFIVKITTNGTLIKKNINILKKYDNIKQINISLQCENKIKNYFENIFDSCCILSKKINIVYRIWLLNEYKIDKLSTTIVDKIIDYYKLDNSFLENVKENKNIKIKDNIYLDKGNKFIWPNDNKNSNNVTGTCLATRNQIAILVDGSVVPCCLDYNANLKLGNIFKSDLDSILKSEIFQNINAGFKNHKIYHNLCKNCDYRKQNFN